MTDKNLVMPSKEEVQIYGGETMKSRLISFKERVKPVEEVKEQKTEFGTLSKKYKYPSSGTWESMQRDKVEVSRFDLFKQSLKTSHEFISSNAVGDAYHRNYMEYLEICWADHLGVVITPDIVWYSLLCELAEIVKESPEEFRKWFTRSNDKEEITVLTDSESEMPMDKLISAMQSYVPSNIDSFLPEFSTTKERSLHACQVAFADLASPYYDYSMYCCKIVDVKVLGKPSDYDRLLIKFLELKPIFNSEWFDKTVTWIEKIVYNLSNQDFLRSIFKLEECGSGGQVEVTGWWSKMFRKQPSTRYTYNFSTQLSSIDYTNLSSGNKYKMYSGLISSVVEDNYLVPEFGNVIYKKTNND